MNKENILQIITSFVIALVINIPIAYAQLTNPKVYGEDMVEGYVRNDETDLFTFEVEAEIENTVVNQEQVRLWGNSYDSGIPFTSCTKNEMMGYYECKLEKDVSEYIICPIFTHRIYLYSSEGGLVSTVPVTSVCDNTNPEIKEFRTNEDVYNADDTVQFIIEIKDKADIANKCVGIKNAELEIGSYSQNIEIDTGPGECSYSDKVSVDANSLKEKGLEGELEAKLTAYDNFDLNSDESTTSFSTDFSGPVITYIEITDKDGGEIGYFIKDKELFVDIKVNFTDDNSVDVGYARLTSSDLDIVDSRANHCTNNQCVWDNKRIKMREPSGDITVTLKDVFGNYNSQNMPYIFFVDTTKPVISGLRVTDLEGGVLGWNNGIGVQARVIVNITEGESGLDESTVKADLSALNDNLDYHDLPKTGCETHGDDSICRWDIRIEINIEHETAQTVTLKFSAEDKAGNKKETNFNYDLLVDNKEPVFDNLISNHLFEGEYYIGNDTEFKASITENGVGVNESNIYLDLSVIGLENEVEANGCSKGWSCYWNVENNAYDGSEVTIIVSGEDDLGNEAEELEQVFIVDITDPVILENEINILPEYPIHSDVLKFYVNVTEENLYGVYVNTSEVSNSGRIEEMYCGEDNLEPNKHRCYLDDVGNLKEEFTEGKVKIIAVDGAGNKAVEEVDVTIYTLETMDVPNFFEIQEPINFVPKFIDKQAASHGISISVFISPEIKVKDDDLMWEPHIISMKEDCSDTERLTHTGLLNEYSNNPYIHVRVSSSVAELEEEFFPIECTLELKVQVGRSVYAIEEEEEIKVEVPLYNIPLGTIEDRVMDKVEDSGKKLEELDKKIDRWDGFNNALNVWCTIARNIAQIDAVLQGVLTVIAGVACALTWLGISEAIHDPPCGVINTFHTIVRKTVWDPNILPVPPTLGYFSKWICMIHSGFLCNANALGQFMISFPIALTKQLGGSGNIEVNSDSSSGLVYVSQPRKSILWPFTGKTTEVPKITGSAVHSSLGKWGIPASRTNVEAIIEPSYWTYDPYKSIHYSAKCLFLPGMIYNWRKERQIECMKIKCLYENAGLGLPIDICEKAYAERYCLYVESAQHRLHGHSWGKWFGNIWKAMLKDEVQLVLTALGTVCLFWDYTAASSECPKHACAVFFPDRVCSAVSTAQAIKNIKDIIDGGFVIKPYEDELKGYDYCEDIEDYL